MEKLITLTRRNPKLEFKLKVAENADHWLILYCGLGQYVAGVKSNWITTSVQTFVYLRNDLLADGQLPRIECYSPRRNDGLVFARSLRTYNQWLISANTVRHYCRNWGKVAFYPFQAFS